MDPATHLNAFLIGIDTYQNPVIFMWDHREVCLSAN